MANPSTPATSALLESESPPGSELISHPLVEIDDVTVVFESRRGIFRSTKHVAVDGVSLAIARGETVGLVGESGSGKTTVGRVCLRLLRPNSGTVRFDGRDVTDLADNELHWLRRRAQIVFQDPFSSLNPYMRVGDLVEEPLVIDGVNSRRERTSRVHRALEAVELLPAERVAARYPTAMSGGQRQRIGIARALVRDPEFIVADEPVSMIDASSRIEILDLLRSLQELRGVSFLYITHDIASARHFADRIAVMYRGRIVEIGTAAEVIDHAVHPYTQALLAAVPEPDPSNRFRRRAVSVADKKGSSSAVHPGCEHGNDAARRRPELLPLWDAPGHQVACHIQGAI